MSLLENVSTKLREEDKPLLSFLDLQKTDDEIIESLTASGVLSLGDAQINEDQDPK